MAAVATATATTQAGQAHRLPNRPNLVSVGTIVWLSSELMFFAALFAMYFTIRSVTRATVCTGPGRAPEHVPGACRSTPRSWCCPRVTCQMGVFAAERGRRRRKLRHAWFILTFLMGAVFVGGQVYEYQPW